MKKLLLLLLCVPLIGLGRERMNESLVNTSKPLEDTLISYQYNSKGLVTIEEYSVEGYPVMEIKYMYDDSGKLIRKETRKDDRSLDKYIWRYRLEFNTIETYHNLYNCKGIFCKKEKHFEYVFDFDSIDCSHKAMFLQRDNHKIQEYELFLSKHKNYKLNNKAKEELLILKEERDYKLAKKINSKYGYNEFISLYPNSEKNKEGYNDGTLERIILIDLITEYNNILNLNSVKAWEEFLSNFPVHCNICISDRVYEDAKYYLSFSKDLNAWEYATDEGSYESYSEYLVNFIPLKYNGRNREESLERIDSIVEPEWGKIKKKNMIVSYAEFIKKYPNSSYAKLADEAAWDQAVEKNKITYYKRYLENLPEGDHIQECMKKLMDLEIAYEESKGKYSGGLPTLNQNDEEYINSNEHVFTIINMTRDIGNKTPKTLLVSFRGHTDDGYVTGNYTIRIGDCVERIFAPGTYYFVVETKGDKSIEKYRNTEIWDFQGGSRTEELELGVFPLNRIPKPMTQEEKIKLLKKYLKCFSKDFQEIIKSYDD